MYVFMLACVHVFDLSYTLDISLGINRVTFFKITNFFIGAF